MFQRIITVPQDLVARFRFQFVALGISQSADVTINNDFITAHTGGYTSIVQPVPAQCIQSDHENVVRIVVSNLLDRKETFPLRPLPSMAKNYGGITRDIYLLGTPNTYIDGITISADEETKSGIVKVRVLSTIERGPLPPGDKSLGCQVELFDKISGMSVGKSGIVPVVFSDSGSTPVEATVAVHAIKRWSPDNPDLYVVRSSLVPIRGDGTPMDVDDTPWGFRDISIDNQSLLLNGERLVLKGVIWNEDHPAFGDALSFEQMEKDIALIKTLGANAVRFVGHPPHPHMLDLCDQYGLLALVDLPLQWVPGAVLEGGRFHEQATSALREMITQNRNHPSVLCWGIGDGLDMTGTDTRDALGRLVSVAHALDARPLYAPTTFLSGDRCTDLMDIAALEIMPNDRRDFRTLLDAWKKAHPHKPVIVASFGSEVQEENRRGSNDPYSQEAQARLYLQRFDLLKAADFSGGIVRSFNDWTSAEASLTVHTGDPWLESMGLVNGNREKRLAFDAVRAAMHGEKFVALSLGSYSNKTPIVFVLAGFAFLVGMVYLYNRNRRFRENLNRSIFSAYNFFADIRDQHDVAFSHTLLLGLGASAGMGLMVESIAFHFRNNWMADLLLSLVLVYDPVKAFVVKVIWNPLTAIGLVAAVVIVLLFLVAGAIYLLRIFFRQRIYGQHAVAVTFWSGAPLLLYIPFGMIAYRVMESPTYVLPFCLFFGVLQLWVGLRLLKGLSIIFDVRPAKMYAAGIAVLVLLLAGTAVAFNVGEGLQAYLRLLYHAATHSA
jgi:hypothetical protein